MDISSKVVVKKLGSQANMCANCILGGAKVSVPAKMSASLSFFDFLRKELLVHSFISLCINCIFRSSFFIFNVTSCSYNYCH